jgi:hypothetical protein
MRVRAAPRTSWGGQHVTWAQPGYHAANHDLMNQ